MTDHNNADKMGRIWRESDFERWAQRHGRDDAEVSASEVLERRLEAAERRIAELEAALVESHKLTHTPEQRAAIARSALEGK